MTPYEAEIKTSLDRARYALAMDDLGDPTADDTVRLRALVDRAILLDRLQKVAAEDAARRNDRGGVGSRATVIVSGGPYKPPPGRPPRPADARDDPPMLRVAVALERIARALETGKMRRPM